MATEAMSTKFVIVGAPRTGSTLLVKTLNSLAGVCCHGELLGEDHVRGFEDGVDLIKATPDQRKARLERLLHERNSNPVRFIERALSVGDTANGFKALYSAFLNPRWLDVIQSLKTMQGIHFIHLSRANSLRRFISEQILFQGGPNHSGPGGKSEVQLQIHCDIELFEHRSAELERQASELRAILSDQTVMEMSYEQLSADTATAVAQACQFFGLEVASSDITPALNKVGAANLQESVSNYQELLDHPATRALALAD